LVAGHSNFNAEVSLMDKRHPVRIDVTRVPELYQVQELEDGVRIGASVTHATAISVLNSLVAKHHDSSKAVAFAAVSAQLKRIATTQVRNVAAIGANIGMSTNKQPVASRSSR
jgi:CO/xanthine dehydrogenase FAD-binding subunit